MQASIDYFKLQAKNLYRDFKTKEKDDEGYYQYTPRFFKDIDGIIVDYDIDEEDFSLMKAQHIIARMAGLSKWADLLWADEDELKVGQLLIENRDKSNGCVPLLIAWQDYMEDLRHILKGDELGGAEKLVLLQNWLSDEQEED